MFEEELFLIAEVVTNSTNVGRRKDDEFRGFLSSRFGLLLIAMVCYLG